MACAACGSVAVRSFGRLGTAAVGYHLAAPDEKTLLLPICTGDTQAAAERSAGDEN